jgi:hypothetical protein
MSGLGVQDALHVPRIHADGERILARSVNYGRNLSVPAHAAGLVLRARFPRLRFQCVLFQSSRHKFQFLDLIVILRRQLFVAEGSERAAQTISRILRDCEMRVWRATLLTSNYTNNLLTEVSS